MANEIDPKLIAAFDNVGPRRMSDIQARTMLLVSMAIELASAYHSHGEEPGVDTVVMSEAMMYVHGAIYKLAEANAEPAKVLRVLRKSMDLVIAEYERRAAGSPPNNTSAGVVTLHIVRPRPEGKE